MGAYRRIEDDYDVHIPRIGVEYLGDPEVQAKAVLGDEPFRAAHEEGYGWPLEHAFVVVEGEAARKPKIEGDAEDRAAGG
jgi:hypothetical protein